MISAALYMRLSVDDARFGESMSIETQRTILRQYSAVNGFTVYSEYVDDGFSGTNYNRPAFLRMISDITAGEVNCVITKDLSRFGRDHIQTDYYLETFFPEHGVRYIAVTDNEDSELGLSDYVPFRNLINEFYSRDASRKTCAALLAKFENGEYAHGRAPFGYMLSAEKKLVPHPETSPIVRQIFQMAADGMGAVKIVRALYEQHVPIPSFYHNGLCQYGLDDDRVYNWSKSAVWAILKNPVYTGNLAHHRVKKVSYKSKKSKRQPEDKWIWAMNTHEALVSQELFDVAQLGISSRSQRSPIEGGEVQPIKGCYCERCGKALHMHRSYSQKQGKVYAYYSCQQTKAVAACPGYSVRHEELERIIWQLVRELVQSAKEDPEGLRSRLMTDRIRNGDEQIDQRRRRIEGVIARAYEDKLTGAIDERLFGIMMRNYEAELDELDRQQKQITSDRAGINLFLEKLSNIETGDGSGLNEVMAQLTEKVYIRIDVVDGVKQVEGRLVMKV